MCDKNTNCETSAASVVRATKHRSNKDQTRPFFDPSNKFVELVRPIEYQEDLPRGAQGWNDLEVLSKYAFFASDEHEARAAPGLEMFLPCGSLHAGGSTHTYMGLMLATGLGDLPRRDGSSTYAPARG